MMAPVANSSIAPVFDYAFRVRWRRLVRVIVRANPLHVIEHLKARCCPKSVHSGLPLGIHVTERAGCLELAGRRAGEGVLDAITGPGISLEARQRFSGQLSMFRFGLWRFGDDQIGALVADLVLDF